MPDDSTTLWTPLECIDMGMVDSESDAADHLRAYAPIHAALSAVAPDGGTWSEPDAAPAGWASLDADGALTVPRCYTEEFTPNREQAYEMAAHLIAWAQSQEEDEGGDT